MRRGNGWFHYLHTLAEQGLNPVQSNSIYATQWAHDVRCIRQGVEHRRVGEAGNPVHEEWLLAGYASRALIRK